jgi:peptide/nickel transport system substrate-binding protein
MRSISGMQHTPISRRFFSLSLLLATALLGLVMLAGCGMAASEEEPPQTEAPATAAATAPPAARPSPEPRGGNLTVRLPQDIATLRPWQPRSRGEEQVITLLYSGLVRLDEELRPQPDLAESWQTTSDGRVLTFTLRSDLYWHDGQPLDANDVSFTIERMQALPFTSTALLANLRHIAAVSVPNDNTVVFSLTERFAPLISELSLPILPRHLLENQDIANVNFWDIPIGSGPFAFDNRVPGQSIVLSRFDDYHHGAPLLERVAFVGAADLDITFDALENENLLLAELPWNAMGLLSERVSTVRTGYYPENGFYYLAFNLREGRPFADQRVREALSLAIDVPRLVEAATNGRGIPIASSAVPGSWADLTSQPTGETDLDTARNLLNEAGWVLPEGSTIRQRDGNTFNARLFVRGDDERRLIAAQRIAEAAASIGLQITVEPADFATVIISKYASPYDFDLLLGSWLNGAGDPGFGDYLYYDPDDFALFHSSEINQGPEDPRNTRNFVAFSDPSYDSQAQAARQLYDTEGRAAAYAQAQERVAELLPYIYLWTDRIPVALNNRVTTLDGPVNLSSPMYLWNIERWYVE